MNFFSPINIIQKLAIFLTFVLFVMGASEYPGSKSIYTIFSLIFTVLLLSGFYRQDAYGYLFLVVFLWLGFWFKLTIHMVFDKPFMEAVGGFYGEGLAWFETNIIPPITYSHKVDLQWDKVLTVAMIAALGVLAARVIWFWFARNQEICVRELQIVPGWYPRFRKYLWPLVMTITIAFAVANFYWGILMIGLAPRTVLPWPLNAIIAWMVSTGCVMAIASLTWWDINIKKSATTGVVAIIVEGCISTITLLSRATYIFHVIPQFLALYLNKKKIGPLFWRIGIVITLIFLAVFFISNISVTQLREHYYSDASTNIQPKNRQEVILSDRVRNHPKSSWNYHNFTELEAIERQIAAIKQSKLSGEDVAEQLEKLMREREKLEGLILSDGAYTKRLYEGTKYYIGNILSLAAGRWVGVEGVMAVSAYHNKGMEEFMSVVFERRQIGTASIYQKISNSLYQGVDNERFLFATIPGVAAFFYISDSLIVVFSGVLLLVLLLLMSERIVKILTNNPLLCALFGLSAANVIAQFGLAPLDNGPYFFMWLCGIVFIWLIQSRKIFSAIKRLLLICK